MALLLSRNIELKFGTLCIRSATAADAPALLAFNRTMAAWELSVAEPDEVPADVQALINEIELLSADPQRLRLVAENQGHVIGGLDFVAPARRRIRHRGRFGIAVAENWRGRGIGAALIHAMLDWARAHPHIEKVRLNVLSENTRAVALYQRLGFAEEARRVAEYKFPAGRYCDDIMMSLWVKPRPPLRDSVTP